MHPTHMQLNLNCISFTFTEDYITQIFVHFCLCRLCLSSEYPERDIFHSGSSSRRTSSVLCSHAPSCMNPVVLTLLTLCHVQKGRHGVWFPSPLTLDPTKDHSWDFVALYVKTFNSQACTVQLGKTCFFTLILFLKDRLKKLFTLFPHLCIHASKDTCF